MLFPDLVPSGLVGIARLAAGSEVLEAKRRVEYRELETRRFIGRASGTRMPFAWTINPYRGCEFGCRYCYARYTHEFMELRETEQFERLIFAKHFDAAAFRQELKRIPRTESIAIGTATDPYQPAERRFGITRRILEVFADECGRKLSITSKSDLVARDTDLLSLIAKRNVVQIFETITTTDEDLARTLEPYAPRPALRVECVRKLSGAGLRVAVGASPVMPLINDSHASLSAVAQAAADAGALYLMAQVLFLQPCAQKAFFPTLEERFPHLIRRYRDRYGRRPYLEGPYPAMLAGRVREIRQHYGLTQKPSDFDSPHWTEESQLSLFDEAQSDHCAS